MTILKHKPNVFVPAGAVIVLGQDVDDAWGNSRNYEFPAGSHGLLIKSIGYGWTYWNEAEILIDEKACKLSLQVLQNSAALFMDVCDALKGKSFCFSGQVTYQRNALIKIVELQGGEYKSSVTKNCSYLVSDDAFLPGKQTTKVQAAKAAGTSIITLKEFFSMAKAAPLK